MVIYADDIALYQIIQSLADYLLVQDGSCYCLVDDINAIFKWVTDNYLFLNLLKCCHLLFSRKRLPTLPNVPLMINGNVINNVTETKYQGVILSSNISWSNHISAICSKAWKLIGVLYRKFYHHSEPQTLLRLYQSLYTLHHFPNPLHTQTLTITFFHLPLICGTVCLEIIARHTVKSLVHYSHVFVLVLLLLCLYVVIGLY